MSDDVEPEPLLPPEDLVAGGRGHAFWVEVTTDYDLSVGDVEVLAEACRQLDLLDALRDAIGNDLLVESKSGPRTNPLLVEQRQTRIELRRHLSQLCLPDLDDEPGELPEEVANIRTARARKAALARWSHGGV